MFSAKVKIVLAAIISPVRQSIFNDFIFQNIFKFLAIFQLLNSSCIIRNLKPAALRHGFYTYYLEMPNGTRQRQMADVIYDERQGRSVEVEE